MAKIVHDLIQGSDEWHQHRAKHFNASDAAAMLGISPYITRDEFLKQKALGIDKEVTPEMQERFNRGHEYEAMARPWAEEILGEDLYPATVSIEVDGLHLSASTDGITMEGGIVWEHKTLNADNRRMAEGEIPEHYLPQLEQIMLITGAELCLIMASAGDHSQMCRVYYNVDIELRHRILMGWKQFAIDLANYKHVEVLPAPAGKSIVALPALTVRLIGEVTESNLALYRSTALQFIADINTTLVTDQDFADAEKTVTFCKNAEDELELVKKQALDQTITISELFRTVDMLKESMRAKRLEIDKLVKVRKESIRAEIMKEAIDALYKYRFELGLEVGFELPELPTDFHGAMKNKKLLSSLRDSVNTELARAKIEISKVAIRVTKNLVIQKDIAQGYEFLFPEMKTLLLKDVEDFENLLRLRISEHKVKEEQRIADERERIRVEELAKIERERMASISAAHQEPSHAIPIASKPLSAPLVSNWGAEVHNFKQLFSFIMNTPGFEHWIDFNYEPMKQFAASNNGNVMIPGVRFYQVKAA